MYIKTAVIPVGGKGSRMSQSQRLGIQKCLIPIKGNPVLYYVIESLRRQGVQKIYLLANHLSQQITDFVYNNYKRIFTDVSAEVIQTDSRSTADALLNLKGVIKESFLYSNGDIAFHPNIIDRLLADHDKDAIATMAFSNIQLASTHPYCDIDQSNGMYHLKKFEFPTKEKPHSLSLCSMETMILSPEIFDYLPHAKDDMVVKAIDYARQDGRLVKITAFSDDWLHLEVDEDIQRAETRDFLKLYGSEE